jgi:hypothetical protein
MFFTQSQKSLARLCAGRDFFVCARHGHKL